MGWEKPTLYAAGAITVFIAVWVMIAFVRSEGIWDWKMAGFAALFIGTDFVRRRRRKLE